MNGAGSSSGCAAPATPAGLGELLGELELQFTLTGQVDGFEIARECHELAILDALSRDAERRKQPAHVSILYLGEAHATASSLLAKKALPAALRAVVSDWQQRISAGIDRLRIGAHLESAGIGGGGAAP